MFLPSQKSNCHDLPKSELMGGCSCQVKSQTAKICLNLNFWGRGCSCQVESQSAKICLNLNGGGVQYQIPEQGVLANLSKNVALPLESG